METAYCQLNQQFDQQLQDHRNMLQPSLLAWSSEPVVFSYIAPSFCLYLQYAMAVEEEYQKMQHHYLPRIYALWSLDMITWFEITQGIFSLRE